MQLRRFLDFFAVEHGRTRRLVEILPEVRFAWRPNPSMRSVGELVQHIIDIYRFLEHMVADGSFSVDSPPGEQAPASAEEAVRRLDEAFARAQDRMGRVAEERFLAGEVRPFGYPQACQDAAREVVEHAIHHRGELSAYARLVGVTPPYLFAPPDDPVLQPGGM